MKGKGISLIVATVLLIAFVMSAAAVFGPWASGLITQVSEDVDSDVVSAANSRLDVFGIKYDKYEDRVYGTFQNSGEEDLTNFTVTVIGDTPVQKQVNKSLGVGEATSFEIEGVQGAESVRVDSRQVPTKIDYSLEDEDIEVFENFTIVVDTSIDGGGYSGSDSFYINCGAYTCGSNPVDYDISVNGTTVNTTEELTGVDGSATVTWDSAGVYEVSIKGEMPHFSNNAFISGNVDHEKIVEISQWGDVKWNQTDSMFEDSKFLTAGYDDNPDLSQVEDAYDMFRDAQNFNGDLSGWETGNIEDMSRMFRNALSFNSDISGWNTSNVKFMKGMFTDASSFNQNIGGWDTGKVTKMQNMFNGASDFNQDIGDWDTSNVDNMGNMFRDASSFNQDISDWCVENIGSKPDDFDTNTHPDFEDNPSKQPDWGTTC